jgi:hypothetical protein
VLLSSLKLEACQFNPPTSINISAQPAKPRPARDTPASGQPPTATELVSIHNKSLQGGAAHPVMTGKSLSKFFLARLSQTFKRRFMDGCAVLPWPPGDLLAHPPCLHFGFHRRRTLVGARSLLALLGLRLHGSLDVLGAAAAALIISLAVLL